MSPTLKSGDHVFIKPGRHVGIGDIVIAKHPFKRNFTLVKHVDSIANGHYVLRGLNSDESTDSRFFGTVNKEDIVGKVTSVIR